MEARKVVFKKRAAKNIVRKAPPPPSDSESSGSDVEDNDGRIVKRRKINTKVFKVSSTDQKAKDTFVEGTTKYDADRSAKIEASSDATKQSNWYEQDAENESSTKNPSGTIQTKPESLLKKNPDAPSRQMGPMKAPTNIRTITVTDYAPDVCKDYKQTGFCGFGDNCKFLHAREDYAAGWKLDQEWERSGKAKQGGTVISSRNRRMGQKEDEEGFDTALLEKIPFACIICKNPYTRPIITRCSHYFCESCAMQRYRKDPTCAACGANTGGVFNAAKNLKKLLERKQKMEEKTKDSEKEKTDE